MTCLAKATSPSISKGNPVRRRRKASMTRGTITASTSMKQVSANVICSAHQSEEPGTDEVSAIRNCITQTAAILFMKKKHY